jgi:hypothetical protein
MKKPTTKARATKRTATRSSNRATKKPTRRPGRPALDPSGETRTDRVNCFIRPSVSRHLPRAKKRLGLPANASMPDLIEALVAEVLKPAGGRES